MGHESSEVFQVTELDPDRKVGLYVDGRKGTTGKGEIRFRYTFTPEAGGTRMHVDGSIDGGGGWFARLVGRRMLPMMRKMIDKDHQALMACVEAQG